MPHLLGTRADPSAPSTAGDRSAPAGRGGERLMHHITDKPLAQVRYGHCPICNPSLQPGTASQPQPTTHNP